MSMRTCASIPAPKFRNVFQQMTLALIRKGMILVTVTVRVLVVIGFGTVTVSATGTVTHENDFHRFREILQYDF